MTYQYKSPYKELGINPRPGAKVKRKKIYHNLPTVKDIESIRVPGRTGGRKIL